MKSIKEIVFANLKKLTSKKFTEASNIYEIGIDSLDLVELIVSAEDELGISISDETLSSIKTVKDVIVAFDESKK